MMRRAILLLAIALCAACDAPTASRPEAAYDATSLTRGLHYRWASGRQVSVWVVDGPSSIVFDLALAVRQSMAAWNTVPRFGEFTLVQAASVTDADVIVFDRASAMPVVAGSCPFAPSSAAGYTYFCPVGSAPTTAEHLALAAGGAGRASVAIRVDRGRIADQAGYLAVVAHEFGHALGIGGHSDQARDLMFGAPVVAVPSARDLQTLQSVLGVRPDITL